MSLEQNVHRISPAGSSQISYILGVLLEYPTTTGFQWGLLKNGPYTYTASGGIGRVF